MPRLTTKLGENVFKKWEENDKEQKKREMLMEDKIRTLRKDRNVKRREKEIGKENSPKKRRKIEIEKEKLTEKEKQQSEREDTIRRSQ